MIRNGIGYDVHAFAEGRRLVLGGVDIPHSRGLLGHSDADVLTHAIADALLGAVAAGDIGHHFPNTDPRWEGVSSLLLLREVVKILRSKEAWPVHVDAMLIAEEPKVMPHLTKIRHNLAEALGLPFDRVSVKATTNETMGFIGRREGIAAMATATVDQIEQGPEFSI